MPDSGKDLGLDLFELYQVGTQDLPAVAAQYSTAGSRVVSASDGASSAFQRHQIFGGTTGPAYGEWHSLCQTIGTFLRDTGENLRDTGEALVLAANNYVATDQAAKDEFDRLKREHGMS